MIKKEENKVSIELGYGDVEFIGIEFPGEHKSGIALKNQSKHKVGERTNENAGKSIKDVKPEIVITFINKLSAIEFFDKLIYCYHDLLDKELVGE